VIGVGAADTNGTASTRDDDVGSFSASGCPSCKRPDLVAPGAHLQGLRVPGSFIDDSGPAGILDSRYMRGSGTSEATAITSGAVALILQRYPSLTPDQVKQFLLQGTDKLHGTSPNDQGGGELDLNGLLNATPPGSSGKAARPERSTASTGAGPLEEARGADHLSIGGVVLQGNIDIFGHPFDSTAEAAAESAANSWSGGTWNGSIWDGTWSSNSWSGSSWLSNSWSSNSWSGSSWSSNSWSSNSWSSNSWSSNSWSSDSWSSAGWS
jgi:serine protease AprX